MNTGNKIESYFFPIVATLGDESSAALLAKWAKLDTLSESSKNKLTSQKTAEGIQKICIAFNLNWEQSSLVAIIVRDYYFGELKLEDMPFYLAKEIPIDFSKAKEITNLIIQKIINDTSQEIVYQAQLDNLPLSDALKVYPEIGEQMITSERISLKNFPEPVRPSLKNWLADYTFTVGYDNKDSIKRGNYIFHGSNTLRLLAADREKLVYILKAHDENTPITVNKETKKIVFPANTERHSVSNREGSQRTPSVQTRPATSIDYQQPSATQRHSVSNAQSELKTPSVPSFATQRHAVSLPTGRQAAGEGSQRTPSVQSDKLHNSVNFSSPQQLPYEKLNTPQPAKQDFVSRVKFPPIQQPRPANSVNNIIKLEPKPEKPREMPRNVVNLKD